MARLSSNHIPNYLEASSKKSLRSLMIKVSAKIGGHVKFFDISQELSGKYSCWFIEEIDEYEVLKEQIGMGEE